MFTLPAKKKSAAESVTTENALSADDYSAPPTKKLRVASSSEKNDEASGGPCWQIVFSPQHGRNYYWNPITRLSSWTLPVGAALKDAPAEQTTLDGSPEDGEEEDEEEEDEYVAPFVAVPRTVTVGGASSAEEARNFLSASCGAIESTYLSKEGGGGGWREWCLKFETESSATKAIFCNGMELDAGVGRKLEVRRTMQKNMGEVVQATKVFLRGLPLSVTDEEILSFCQVDGAAEVLPSVRRIYPRQSRGASSSDERAPWGGLAVVDLRSESKAQHAVKAVNGCSLAPRSGEAATKVTVVISRKRIWEGVSTSENAGNYNRSDKTESEREERRPGGCLKVWIGGLPRDAEEESVRSVFENCGHLASFNFIRDKFEGDCRGFAFAVFSTEEGCEAAIRLNGKHRLGATPLKVKYSKN